MGTTLALAAGVAFASSADQPPPAKSDFAPTGAAATLAPPQDQHGTPANHLPPVTSNIALIGKLRLTDEIDGIADVSVYKNTAYVNAWDGECDAPGNPAENKGGTHVVDISDPANPRRIGFLPAPFNTYHGEGAHVVTLSTPRFQGDVLAVNNETCSNVDDPEGSGGMDLWDVTDPRNPRLLVQGFGDTGGEGQLTGNRPKANSEHSVFMWQQGQRAFVFQVDNIELHDVDIFEITDPRNPLPVAEYDLVALAEAQGHDLGGADANGQQIFFHDGVVKQIGDRWILMASYWDAGYIQVDITDPLNPRIVNDTDFGPDPLLEGVNPAEGNAHQGEYSHDNRFLLTADEDFNPYRAGTFRITTGPNAGEYEASEVGGGTSVAFLPDRRLNGPVVYGGYGCDDSDPIPPRSSIAGLDVSGDEEAIVVLQRGPAGDPDNPEEACFPGEKAANGAEAGYDAVLLVNRHLGSEANDSATCGSGGYPPGAQIVTLCTTHEAFHRMFGTTPQYNDGDPDPELYQPGDDPNEPDDADLGDVGEEVEATSVFDGWGYMHLYRTDGSPKMAAVDHHAISEALDPRFAFGFGALSIHEFATDPTEYLAYSSHYAGGVRVFSFGNEGLRQQGAFIDEGGNNFWGIEQFSTGDGKRMLAASDMDYGLYILEYVGPGAAQPPDCEDVDYATSVNTPVTIQLVCRDPNTGNRVTLAVDRAPANGTLSNFDGFKVTYTPRTGFTGRDTFTYVGTDGSLRSRPAEVQVFVGRCARPVNGTDNRDLMNGTAAGDAIMAKAGNDIVDGLQGGDCLFGEAGGDQLDGGSENDLTVGGTGSDRLFGGSGADEMRGGSDRDHLRGSSGNDRAYGDAGNDFVSGGSNNDRLSGGSGRDSLRGEAGNDTILGGAGNDSLAGGQGRDRYSGGSGNDKIDAADGRRETIRCGAGRDRVIADRTDRVSRDCESVRRTRRTRG